MNKKKNTNIKITQNIQTKYITFMFCCPGDFTLYQLCLIVMVAYT